MALVMLKTITIFTSHFSSFFFFFFFFLYSNDGFLITAFACNCFLGICSLTRLFINFVMGRNVENIDESVNDKSWEFFNS